MLNFFLIVSNLFFCFANRNSKNGRFIGMTSMDHSKFMQFHPKSILRSVRFFDKPLVTYCLAIKSKKTFIHDATLTHPLPLVFFGDHFLRSSENNKHIIKIGGHLKFVASDSTANLIHDLRNKMNWFLEHKISHPGPVSWLEESNEIDVLR